MACTGTAYLFFTYFVRVTDSVFELTKNKRTSINKGSHVACMFLVRVVKGDLDA